MTAQANETPTIERLRRAALPIAQLALALTFLGAGVPKLFLSLEELAAMLPAAPSWIVRGIGVAEVSGAVGLLLPPRTPLRVELACAAAVGLFTVMVLAGAAHLARGESGAVPVNVLLGSLAAFVARGRGEELARHWTLR